MPYTSLAEFYSITDHQQTIVANISQLLHNCNENNKALIELIQTTDLEVIIKTALQNPLLDQFCNQECLNNHWAAIWKECGNYGNGTHYVAQTAISCFDLLKSNYLYWLHLEHINTPLLADEFLKLAAEQGCFFAMRALCTPLLKGEQVEKAEAIIKFAKQAATQYLAPGYILLAKVYLALYQRFPQSFQFLNKCLHALFLAEKTWPLSTNECHNVYQHDDLRKIIIKEKLNKKMLLNANIDQILANGHTDIFQEIRQMVLTTAKLNNATKNSVYDTAKKTALADFEIISHQHQSCAIKLVLGLR